MKQDDQDEREGSTPDRAFGHDKDDAEALLGEAVQPATESPRESWADLDAGLLVGLLIGEGHFGGDGRQPQLTLRMHTDHETLFRWLQRTFPGGKLYGPYHHGGRSYFQWMARGAYLREALVPLLDRYLNPGLDAKTYLRYQEMKRRYQLP